MKNKKNIIYLFGIIIFFLTTINNFINVKADDITRIANDYTLPMTIYKKPDLQPFSINSSGHNERISPLNGTLELSITDLYLKGRNGMDFELKRLYSSNEAMSGDPQLESATIVLPKFDGYAFHGKRITKNYVSSNLISEVTEDVLFIKSSVQNEIFEIRTNVNEYFDSTRYWSTSQEAYILIDKLNNGDYNKEIKDNNDATKKTLIIYSNVEIRLAGFLIPDNKTYYKNVANGGPFFRYFNGLGLGWKFDIPVIESRGSNGTKYIHLGDKGTYNFVYPSSQAEWGTDSGVLLFNPSILEYKKKLTIQEYGYNDLELYLYLTRIGTSPNIKTQYILIDKEGKKYYFDGSGKLEWQEDRYGNKITYNYSYSDGRIQSITDSVGRNISFGYGGNDINYSVNVTIADNTDTRIITYYVGNISGLPVLSSFKDTMNRMYTYEYDMNQINFSFTSKDPVRFDGNNDIRHARLKSINYPTGANTKYNWSDIRYTTKNLGTSGGINFYKVTSRADYIEASEYNKKTYTYHNYYIGDNSHFEYDGYPNEASVGIQVNTDIKYGSQGSVDSYTYVYKLNDNAYNYITGQRAKDFVNTRIVSEGNNHKEEVEYSHSNGLLVTQKKVKTYDKAIGAYVESAENFRYDNKKNITEYYGPLAGINPPDNSEYKTSYTYHPKYNYIAQKTYKQNLGKTIIEKFIPFQDATGSTSESTGIEYFEKYEKYKNSQNIDVTELKKKIRYEYDDFGNVITEYDYTDNNQNNSVVTRYEYTGAFATRIFKHGVKDADYNLITSLSGGNTGVIDEIFTYNRFGDLLEYRDSLGNITKAEYDKLSRKIKEINPDNSCKQWQYVSNANSNTVTFLDENLSSIKYVYDKFGNLMEQYTNNILTNQYSYDNEYRCIMEYNIQDGRNIYYTYDSKNQITQKQAKNSAGTVCYTEKIQYNEASKYNTSLTEGKKKVTIQSIGETGSSGVKIIQYFDKLGRLEWQEQVSTISGDSTKYTWEYLYDYLSNLTVEKRNNVVISTNTYNYDNQLLSSTNTEGKTFYNQYDWLGRKTGVIDYKGTLTSFTYDNAGRLIKESSPILSGQSTENKYYYNLNGNLIKELNKANKPGQTVKWNHVDYSYNNRNLLVKVTTYKDSTTPENYTQYYHDKTGKILRTYTGLSKDLTINGLDSVVTNGDSDYSTTKYEYNALGQVSKITDPLDKEDKYTEYDKNGRLKKKTDRNNNTTSYSYNTLGQLTSESVTGSNGSDSYTYTYYITGALKKVSGGGIDITYTYDGFGRVSKETDSTNITREYTYDSNNNRASYIAKNNGTTIQNTTYGYDTMNRLATVKENGLLRATYTYDANGNRATLTYGNGIKTQYSYNLANMLTSLSTVNSGGYTQAYTYTYDYYFDGNQASKTRGSKTTNYTYDGLGRISTVTDNTGLNKSYKYDDNNNRSELSTQLEVFLPDIEAYTYNGFNRIKTITKGGTTASYGYNSSGIRNKKTVNGVETLFVLDGSNVTAEITGNNTKKYVRGINLINLEENGNLHYYLYNGHGDVVQITNSSGTVVASYDYDEFGNITSQTGTLDNPFLYCGEYYDKETGKYYLRARYYDSVTGRFIGEDPARSGLNWYTYCFNNPIMYVDPLGLYLKFAGSDDNKKVFMDALYMITDDSIQLDDDGYVRITGYNENNITKPAGTQLLRSIIDNQKHTTKVSFGYEGQGAITSPAELLAFTTDAFITIDPDVIFSFYVYDFESGNTITESIGFESENFYVILAHELIHADRIMTGTHVKSSKDFFYMGYSHNFYMDSNNKIKHEFRPTEEFLTTGIPTLSIFNKYTGLGLDIKFNLFGITENMIRAEHGLNERVAYTLERRIRIKK